eukprot:TRINITY_DN1650_c0_g1_i1.p1 TRINITY_DN1650_c0_g1~~TRINITY_DN1650_c0_g1_i1.p1  ORF type:complete len:177 (-),score=19.85 TRINITY_DN1650_c0_g1_i1:98-577(-)
MGFLSFTEQFESPIPAARFFGAVADAVNIYPKLVPDFVLSSAILEGDGGSGTIYQYNFSKSYRYSYVKEHHHVVDKENFVDKYTWLEGGDLGTKLKSYMAHIKFEPSSNGGCVCKYGVEYDTIDGVDYTEEMKEERDTVMIMGFKLMENYLNANPEAYA